jgi:hypothetical protein
MQVSKHALGPCLQARSAALRTQRIPCLCFLLNVSLFGPSSFLNATHQYAAGLLCHQGCCCCCWLVVVVSL